MPWATNQLYCCVVMARSRSVELFPEAVMMAIYLEEAAEILYGALQIGTPIPLTLTENQQRQTEALPPVDLERAWRFFKRQVGRE